MVTPPGTANFTLSSQPNNQNNPNVDPQESTNYEVGGKFGVFDNKLSVSLAAFRTENKNVIFTVDATAIPPIPQPSKPKPTVGSPPHTMGEHAAEPVQPERTKRASGLPASAVEPGESTVVTRGREQSFRALAANAERPGMPAVAAVDDMAQLGQIAVLQPA